MAVTSGLDAIADVLDMDTEDVRHVVDILTFTPQLVEQIEAGDLGIYAAWQKAKAAKKLQEREARQRQKQRTKQTNLRINVRHATEANATKQTNLRSKDKPRQRPLTIGDRRLIWLYVQASTYDRIGRCHTCERDVTQPDARCVGIARLTEDDAREVWIHRLCGAQLDRNWTPF
jgi:hypothetical protein